MLLSTLGLGAPFTAIALLLSASQALADSEIIHAAQDSSATSWADLTCSDEHDIYAAFLYPPESWKALMVDDAWADVVRNWKDTDRPGGLTFIESLLRTLKFPRQPRCGGLGKISSCAHTLSCYDWFGVNSTGAAATMLWASLDLISDMPGDFIMSLRYSQPFVSINSDRWGSTIPERSDWLPLLIDVVVMGAGLMVGPYTMTILGQQAYFLANGTLAHNINDTALALMGQAPTIAKEIMINTDKYDWNPAEGVKFEDYFRQQAFNAWSNMTAVALQTLSNGDDASVERLWSIIEDGQLTGGKADRKAPLVLGYDDDETQMNWGNVFYGLIIPAVWRQSGTHAFVMDSGAPCDSGQSINKYLDSSTMNATGICYEEKQYFLVQPAGSSTKGTFSAPMGLDLLDQGFKDGVTRETMIKGSLRTYAANGNKNGGVMDLKDRDTLLGLFNKDFTTPGFMRFPVCTPDEALQSWRGRKPTTNPYYPCAGPDKQN